jgi:hypothetical protein
VQAVLMGKHTTFPIAKREALNEGEAFSVGMSAHGIVAGAVDG